METHIQQLHRLKANKVVVEDQAPVPPRVVGKEIPPPPRHIPNPAYETSSNPPVGGVVGAPEDQGPPLEAPTPPASRDLGERCATDELCVRACVYVVRVCGVLEAQTPW